ncbi:MAG TPA: hypothetical protein VNI83_11265 [Vicinamibacterales bacterium]|nr:hypothetical protein [Vicinamibacterales bacterium]
MESRETLEDSAEAVRIRGLNGENPLPVGVTLTRDTLGGTSNRVNGFRVDDRNQAHQTGPTERPLALLAESFRRGLALSNPEGVGAIIAAGATPRSAPEGPEDPLRTCHAQDRNDLASGARHLDDGIAPDDANVAGAAGRPSRRQRHSRRTGRRCVDLESMPPAVQPVPRRIDSTPSRLLAPSGLHQDFELDTAAVIPRLWSQGAPSSDARAGWKGEHVGDRRIGAHRQGRAAASPQAHARSTMHCLRPCGTARSQLDGYETAQVDARVAQPPHRIADLGMRDRSDGQRRLE